MKNPNVDDFCLIPKVKELRPLGGCIETSAIGRISIPSSSEDYTAAAKYLQEIFFTTAGIRLEIDAGIDTDKGTNICINMSIDQDIRINTGIAGQARNDGDPKGINTNKVYNADESYRLTVMPDGVEMRSPSSDGLFRAAATLIQLIHNDPHCIPCVNILDWPDFPVRGFYHDVTRGRVPTLHSLKRLVDTLAFYKLNQLQLYVEHSFAFSKIPEFSAGKTPLTAADILELDRYCASRCVDLVPSLSTFGHLYELLRLPRFEHLNELDIRASETPRDLWDRMAHYTLDVGNPESFELVKGMIEEYAPLFSSRWFNICCDETFDLGKGKNAERAEREGVGRLYVEFVNKIIGVVKSVGKRPMLWGDIVLKHPEYISELPDDTVFLNWDYLPDAKDESVKKFRDAGVIQYVCPGVQAWSRFAADVDRACANISRMARFGREAGAVGLLNTNWGDCGHINLPAASYHGLAFGAACSWNGEAEDVGVDTNTVGTDIVDNDIVNTDVINTNPVNTDNVDTDIIISTDVINTNPVDTNTVDTNTVDTDTIDTDICNVDTDDFDKRFSLLQWGITGEKGPRLGKLLRELGGLSSYHFGNLYAWVINKQCLWYKEEDVKSADFKELSAKAARAAEIKKELEAIAAYTPSINAKSELTARRGAVTPDDIYNEFKEYVWSAEATAWLLSLLIAKKKYEYGQEAEESIPVDLSALINNGKAILERFKTLWLASGRESELHDVVDTFNSVFERVIRMYT
ncbi:beta-N-acetylhexosaminidase [Fibrobacteres bacterium R8-0-B4]